MASYEEMGRALQGAHDAGDVAAATAIANTMKGMGSAPAAPKQATSNYDNENAVLIGAGRTFDKIGAGIKQGALSSSEDKFKLGHLLQGIPGLGLAIKGLAIGQKVGGFDPAAKAASDRLRMEQQGASEAYDPLQKARPFATGFGEALPGMIATAPMAAGGLLGSVGAGAIGSAAPELAMYGSIEDRLKNAGTAAAIGGAGGALGFGAGKLLNKMGGGTAAQLAEKQKVNAQFDDIVSRAQQAGYVVPPSQTGAGTLGKLAESLSGKFKTEQLASIKNQPVTNSLARNALGASAEDVLMPELTRRISGEAFQRGYAPIMGLGEMPTAGTYKAALDKIAGQYAGASRSFPNAAKNPVGELVDNLRVPSFDAGDAINMTRTLREDAGKAFASGDKALGRANREAAAAIENEIEANLKAGGKNGAGLLKDFRAARVQIAKANDVERALDGMGNVNPAYFAKQLKNGKPLTDELKTIGEFGQSFGKYAQLEKPGNANPFTVLDFATGTMGSAVNPLMAALPVGRVAARYGILSKPYQARLGNSYQAGLMSRIDPRLTGLLGADAGIYANALQER
jgi:hypothetical protein